MPRVTQTRENILEAAMQLFWHNSYEAIGVEAICREANVRKGSFYHFFPSKEDVALELLEMMHERAKHELLGPAFAEDVPPLQRFDRFVDLSREHGETECHRCDTKNYPGCPIGNMVLELSTKSERLRMKLEEIIQTYTSAFETALADAQKTNQLSDQADTELLSNMIAAAWQGGILIAKAHNRPELAQDTFFTAVQQALTEHTK
jgi:TetR/AcrR family transcriptional repressor of nem operon